jgi:Domain of unknown function (DUF4440)
MKHSITILLLSLSIVGILPVSSQTRRQPAGSSGQDAVNAVAKLEDQMRMASLKGLGGWWSDNLADSYVETDGHGKVSNKAEVIALHKSPDLVIETWNLSERNVQTFNGDTVIVTGKMTLVGTYRDQNFSGDYQFTRVWVKQGLEWKLAVSQISARMQ